MADWNKRGIVAGVLAAAAMIGGFYLFGCEARVPLRPEIAQAAGIVAEPGKAAEVPLSAYPTVEAAYTARQEEKAKAERARAAEVADDLQWKTAQATRTVERQIRAMQERLEDDLAAERAKAERAIKAVGVAVESLKAETDRVVKMQAVEVKAAEQRQQVIDQVVGLGLSAANTAAATQGGTPWGGLLVGALGIATAAWQRQTAARKASALDTATAAIEEIDAMNATLAQPVSVPDGKGGTRLITTAGQLAKWQAAQLADVGDSTEIQRSLARQNYAANV